MFTTEEQNLCLEKRGRQEGEGTKRERKGRKVTGRKRRRGEERGGLSILRSRDEPRTLESRILSP